MGDGVSGRRPGRDVAESTEEPRLIALVDGIDELEAQIKALRPSVPRVAGRVGTYFGVLMALTVGVVDSAYLFPWMASALLIAGIPDVGRFLKYRALASERDMLIQRGTERP